MKNCKLNKNAREFSVEISLIIPNLNQQVGVIETTNYCSHETQKKKSTKESRTAKERNINRNRKKETNQQRTDFKHFSSPRHDDHLPRAYTFSRTNVASTHSLSCHQWRLLSSPARRTSQTVPSQ